MTAHDASVNITEPNKITKPILMCFICKLSFGNTKSFSLHANSEHTLNLQESEKVLLNREYSSAIIQRNNDEKPQVSFLEPLDFKKQIISSNESKNENLKLSTTSTITTSSSNMLSNNSSCLSKNSNQNLISNENNKTSLLNSSSPPITSTSSSSLSTKILLSNININSSKINNNVSTGHLNNGGSNSNNEIGVDGLVGQNNENLLNCNNIQNQNVKLLNDYLQQQHHQLQQQSQQLQSQPITNQCPDHIGMKGVDCKNCEMMNINFNITSPLTPTKSPNNFGLPSNVNNLSPTTSNASQLTPSSTASSVSPSSQQTNHAAIAAACVAAAAAAAAAASSQQNSSSQSSVAPSFTIGACPEHINGRQIGVDCAR